MSHNIKELDDTVSRIFFKHLVNFYQEVTEELEVTGDDHDVKVSIFMALIMNAAGSIYSLDKTTKERLINNASTFVRKALDEIDKAMSDGTVEEVIQNLKNLSESFDEGNELDLKTMKTMGNA